jgi:hypothetical protein
MGTDKDIRREASIPPLRALEPSRLRARHEHLLAEITRAPGPRLPRIALPRHRFRLAALAASGACAAVLSVVLVQGMTSGADNASRSPSPYLTQAIEPVWGPSHTFTSADDSLVCTSQVATLFGCGGRFALPPAEDAVRSGPATDVPTSIRGGAHADRSVLSSIVSKVRPNGIEQISLRSSKGTLTLRMHASRASTRTLWQEWLIAGAFSDRAASARKVVLMLANDQRGEVIQPGPRRASVSAGATAIEAARQRFAKAAAKVGVELEELTVHRPHGVAVAVSMTSPNAPEFLYREMPVFLAEVGDLWRDYDGVYIALTDDSGDIVWELAAAARASKGFVRSRRRIASCSPLASWESVAPPCPASSR